MCSSDLSNVREAIEQLRRFMAHDKPQNRAQQQAEKRYQDAPAVFSYEHDDEYIFAAFMQLYGINLAREQDMHWYEFRALLSGLDECPFTRIKGWRGTDLSKIEDAKTRARYGELKELWALPISAHEQREMDEIEQILRDGGDLSAYMAGRESDNV